MNGVFFSRRLAFKSVKSSHLLVSLLCYITEELAHLYDRGTTLGIYLFSLAGMLIFTFTLRLELIWVVFLCAGIFGGFFSLNCVIYIIFFFVKLIAEKFQYEDHIDLILP